MAENPWAKIYNEEVSWLSPQRKKKLCPETKNFGSFNASTVTYFSEIVNDERQAFFRSLYILCQFKILYLGRHKNLLRFKTETIFVYRITFENNSFERPEQGHKRLIGSDFWYICNIFFTFYPYDLKPHYTKKDLNI